MTHDLDSTIPLKIISAEREKKADHSHTVTEINVSVSISRFSQSYIYLSSRLF